VSSCPCGQGAGRSAWAMGRLTSKVVPQARHLTSYLGTRSSRRTDWVTRSVCLVPLTLENVPRSNRPRRPAAGVRPAPVSADDLETRLVHGGGRLEEHPDGAWRVRGVPGAAASKAYMCPGCRQQIVPGTPHVVAWPAERMGAFGGPGDRRHWHTACWSARDRRR
jgi:hypothetical protein